jgi:protein-S-isoprenylcysteine O-methyltransferase Ste14
MLIAALFYILGLWAPWQRWTTVDTSTAWLALSGGMARLHWMPLRTATDVVTISAIVLAFAGAALRVWGTAYLGAGVVVSGTMQAPQVIADGPYRHVRNPLYLGLDLFSCAVAILMPVTGAAVFLIATWIFYYRLALGEEDFLTVQQGAAYLEYKRQVPRMLPSPMPRVPRGGAQPHWLQALLGELYPVSMACCFLVLSWRYNVDLMLRALLICFGASLVMRAVVVRPKTA